MALDELLDEHEQGVRVQQWIRKHGPSLLLGLAAGIAALLGWSWYQSKDTKDSYAQADQYTLVEQAIAGNAKDASTKVNALTSPGYAVLAKLDLAKAQVSNNQNDLAIATLRSIKSDDAGLASIANVRLARLLTETGKPNDAINLLKGKDSPESLEALGDAYFAGKQNAQAQTAFKQALSKLPTGSAQRQILELKLTQAGGTPATTTEVKS